MGVDVAEHNAHVREIFERNGIDYDRWLHYDETRDFLVSTDVVVDKTQEHLTLLQSRAEDVMSALLLIKDAITEREYAPLTHILQGTENKKGIMGGQKDELAVKLKTLEKRIRTLQEKYNNTVKWSAVNEHMGHLREAVEAVLKKEKKEVESRERGFRIKTWDRDPRRDMFEGNYTQCCIAVGVKSVPEEGGLTTHDPSTVMQFLADTGISVVEIYDSERKNPIGNTWVFVSKNDLGEPILVADNVEIHSDYTSDPHVKAQLRENLFDFLAEYAKSCGLVGAGIDLVGTNDVSYKDLPKMSVPAVDTISGYLEQTSSTLRPGRYYLEAYKHRMLGAIRPEVFEEEHENIKETNKKEEVRQTGYVVIEHATGQSEATPLTEETLSRIQAGDSDFFTAGNREDIARLEREDFDDETTQPVEEVLQTLSNKNGVQILAKEGERITGYLSSLPASEAELPYRNDHFDDSDSVLYVESIAGSFDPYRVLRDLKENAQQAGYTKIALHGINKRLNRALARFGFETKEITRNWIGGKNAAYMELTI